MIFVSFYVGSLLPGKMVGLLHIALTLFQTISVERLFSMALPLRHRVKKQSLVRINVMTFYIGDSHNLGIRIKNEQSNS